MQIASKSQAENGNDNETMMTPLRVKQSIKANAITPSSVLDYSVLNNKPKINNVELNGNKSTNELGIKENVQANWNTVDNTDGSYIKNKPTIPSKISDLTNDSDFATEQYVDDVADTKVSKVENKTIDGIEYTNTIKNYIDDDITQGATVRASAESEDGFTESYFYVTSLTDIYTEFSFNSEGERNSKSGYASFGGYTEYDEEEDDYNSGMYFFANNMNFLGDEISIDGLVEPYGPNMPTTKDYVDNAIPTVNNATLTIQKNGTSVGTFTANASSNVTANITVPTKTSDLTNDSNFATKSYVDNLIEPLDDRVNGEATEELTGASSYSVDNTLDMPFKDITQLLGDTTQNGTPTPDSPVEVKTVTGRQEVKVVGKNLFNTTETTRTLIKDTTRTINITPASTLTLQAGTYTISFPNLIMQNNNYNMGVQLVGVESGGQQLTNKSRTITINETKTLQSLYIYLNSNDNANATATFSKIMLEKSSSATSYEPYQEQVNEINLGKNLLNATSNSITASGLTITKNADYSYTLNGTYSGNTYWYRLADNFTIPAGTYTLSNSNPDVSNNSAIFCDDGNSFSARTNIETKTFTNERTIKPYIRISAGVTFDNFTIKPMIEKGTQATSYSPYFIPIELCKIGTYQDKIFKNSGKNLFNKDNANVLNAKYGATITADSNERMIYIPCKPNTTYTLYHVATSPMRNSIGTTQTLPAIGTAIENGVYSSTSPKTITTNANAKYIVWQIYAMNDTTHTLQEILDSIMINEGSTALDYEPYGSGEWYVKKNIGKEVLNGSESWGMDPSGVFNQLSAFSNKYLVQNAYSNYFTNIVNANIQSNNSANSILTSGQFSFRVGSTKDRIYIKKTDITSANDFKTWLSTHNTIVYYVLATPTYEKLNDTLQEQLNTLQNTSLIKGHTNIMVDGDLPAIIDFIVYLDNLEGKYESLKAACEKTQEEKYELYEDASGSSSVDLNDSVANYEYLEIFYKINYLCGSVKIYRPYGASFEMTSTVLNGNNLQIFFAQYSISGSTISKSSEYLYTIVSGGTNTKSTTSVSKIYKVIGYK